MIFKRKRRKDKEKRKKIRKVKKVKLFITYKLALDVSKLIIYGGHCLYLILIFRLKIKFEAQSEPIVLYPAQLQLLSKEFAIFLRKILELIRR